MSKILESLVIDLGLGLQNEVRITEYPGKEKVRLVWWRWAPTNRVPGELVELGSAEEFHIEDIQCAWKEYELWKARLKQGLDCVGLGSPRRLRLEASL